MQLNIGTSHRCKEILQERDIGGVEKVETMKRRKRKMADRAAGVG